jgi:hypothetical protein
VTRFYTSKAIRHAMAQMEEFDASLRAAIESGGETDRRYPTSRRPGNPYAHCSLMLA